MLNKSQVVIRQLAMMEELGDYLGVPVEGSYKPEHYCY